MSEANLIPVQGADPERRLRSAELVAPQGEAGRQPRAGKARIDGRPPGQPGQGALRPQGRGLGRFFKKALAGEGVDLMVAGRTGDVFLAHNARKIMILDLQGETLTVNGDNMLAFEEGVDWDIVPPAGAGRLAGGAFDVVLHGTGKVAVTAQGDPVLPDTSTSADPDSAIAWSGGVRTRVKSDVTFNTFLGRDSGETFQIAFGGAGWVLMQPSEGPTVPPTPTRTDPAPR